jgi:glycosyltransferase involved in cell wall biosynthesis
VTERTGVLFLNSPEVFGADTWVQALLMRYLDRARFDVHAACTAGSDAEPTESIQRLRAIPDVHVRPTNFGRSLSFQSNLDRVRAVTGMVSAVADQAALVRYIRQRGIRIIHSTDRLRDALPCLLLARASGAKAVIHIHIKCDTWMSRPVKFAMRNADALIGVSQHVARSTAVFGIPGEKAHAVLNAIEPHTWDPGLDPGSVRSALGIPQTAPMVICVARLFHWKGQAELIRALALVNKEFPETRLVIVGAEDKMSGSSRPNFMIELRALVDELKLEDRVLFTGKRADVPKLLAASDVFAMASFEEPFGLVYAEAMAMKRPVVGLTNGGTPEVVDHGKTGLLAPPGDIRALAEHLAALIRDPALRARMGEQGRREVEARFTAQRMARDVERVYAGLLS